MADVQHIFKGAGAPATAPSDSGHHYVDTTAKESYLSVDSSASSDWKKVASSRVVKSDIIAGASFSGTPQVYDVVFTTAMPSTSYSIIICSTDGRSFTYENKTTSGFRINTNADTAISGEVSWSATVVGETT